MQVLVGTELVKAVREVSDRVRDRLWIAVPYIGSFSLVKIALGRRWLDSDDVKLRLIVDVDERACLNHEAVRRFVERGHVRSLRGLHAKVYIADDEAIVTSANLTRTAFVKRHEVGLRLTGEDAKAVADVYDGWWRRGNCKDIGLDELLAMKKDRRGWPQPKQDGDEPGAEAMPDLWKLPEDPGGPDEAGHEFGDYDAFLSYYREFADSYKSAQRLWPDVPLYLETDSFLNYLFHEATGRPSYPYMQKKPRAFGGEDARRVEIARWAGRFTADAGREQAAVWVREKSEFSKQIRSLLAPDRIDTISREDVKVAASGLNCMASLALNRVRFLNPRNNDLSDIRAGWKELLHSTGAPSARMERCRARLNYFGRSAIPELLGFYWPEKYPLRNRNVNAGLRFFGYPVSAY